MATIKNWIKACRFRTLPLAASVILAGSALVYLPGYFNWAIFLFSLITTFLLQIVSNLANDYGDYSSGADGADRIGPKRTMQEGVISKKEMTIALILFSGLSLFSGSALLYLSFTKDELVKVAIFFGLGIVAIIAAIKYTVGRSAYGYRGFGDLAVFIFFGLIGVLGSAYLHFHIFVPQFILIAICFGLLSAAVLNINNMRDIENDKVHNKITIVVKMGLAKAKKYHLAIVLIALSCFSFFIVSYCFSWKTYLPIVIFPLLLIDAIKIQKLNSEFLDPFLKRTAIFTFLLSLLFFISQTLN